jgi:hypothetical protein
MYGNGTYRNSGIRLLQTYADALETYNNVEPIRGSGRNAGLKPLGHRNRIQFQLLKGSDNEIKCRLYDTDVVVFYPDGTIKITDATYTTQTTANFIEDVLGIRGRVSDHDIVLSIHGNHYRLAGGMILKRNEEGRLQVLQVAKAYTHTVDRKVMKKLRASVKDFMSYLNGSIKVRDNGLFSNEEKQELVEYLDMGEYAFGLTYVNTWRHSIEDTRAKLAKFFALIESGDMENWYRASCWLAFSQYSWLSGARLNITEARSQMDKFLMAANPEALIRQEVPEGTVIRDRYRKIAELSGA